MHIHTSRHNARLTQGQDALHLSTAQTNNGQERLERTRVPSLGVSLTAQPELRAWVESRPRQEPTHSNADGEQRHFAPWCLAEHESNAFLSKGECGNKSCRKCHPRSGEPAKASTALLKKAKAACHPDLLQRVQADWPFARV